MRNILKIIPKKYLFIIGFALVSSISFAIWLPRYTTSNPNYCLRCHGENGGLPNRGLASKIHPSYDKVTCVDCHSKPNQIIYEGYVNGFMADVDRITPNCIRCHQNMLTKNDTLGFKFNQAKIGIPHQFHLKMGAKCTDCHANIAHDLNSVPTNRPRMEYCSQCHATTIEPCSKCHLDKPPAGKIPLNHPSGLLGDGKTLYNKYCSSCHGVNGAGVENVNLQSKELFEKYDVISLRKKTLDGHNNMPPFDINKGGALSEDEVRAIIAHLKLSSNIQYTNGQSLYENYCVVCHGVKGNKIPRTDFSSKDYMSKLSFESIINTIRRDNKRIHAFDRLYGGNLSYESILAIGKYLPSMSKPLIDTTSLASEGSTADAFGLFQSNCFDCHGQKGTDVPGVNLFSGNYLKGLGDKRFVKSVTEGTGSMPGVGKSSGGVLSIVEINALLSYFKGKAGLGKAEVADKTLREKAPRIPHEVSKEMEDCMECHSIDGIKPFPKDHSGRTVKMCKTCHVPAGK